MTEYIDREAAIKAIEFSKGVGCSGRCTQGIKYIPAADVVEVVRCKDCKWFVDEGMLCGNNIFIHFDHFYCYYGERKEGEG